MTVHVYGGAPPEAASVCKYETPTVPGGKVGAVVMPKPCATFSVNDLLVVTDALSVTWTVKLKLPDEVGAPLTTPLENVTPLGSAPEVMVHE